jgi:hypothetical protein
LERDVPGAQAGCCGELPAEDASTVCCSTRGAVA